MPSFLLSVISTTAVSTALLAALAWLLRSWIGERLKNAIRHEYDRDIESYKSVLALVHSATAEGQKAAIEMRMRAFDRVWKAILALRNNTGAITTFLDHFTVDEYKELKDHKTFVALVGELDDSRIQKMMPDLGVEETRPYVGEVVWALFFVYQALNIRIVLLSWQASEKDENKIHWYRDRYTRSLLEAALNPDELQKFDSAQIGKVSYFRRVIESKILVHWHRLISGAEFGDEALKQAEKILEAADRIGRRV